MPGRRPRRGPRRRAPASRRVPLSSALLLAAMRGRAGRALRRVARSTTGYVTGSEATRRCRAGWRPAPSLAGGGRATPPGAEAALRAHRDHPSTELRRELGLTEPRSRRCSTRRGRAATSTRTSSCGWAVHRDGGPALRLRYRTDVLDEDGRGPDRRLPRHRAHAARRRPGRRARRRQSLLSDGRTPVPARRARRAAPRTARPPGARAVRGAGRGAPGRGRGRARRPAAGRTASSTPVPTSSVGRCWRGGCGREGVVAVVTERNLDWMAAVLGDLQGGRRLSARGAALPRRAHRHHPRPRRVRAGAHRAGQHGHAGPGPVRAARGQRLLVEDAYDEAHPDDDLGMAIAPDQLAYIYFTSGSTGRAQGRDVRARRDAQPPPRQARRPRHRRGRRGRADRAPVLRHLPVAAAGRAAGRRADAARGAGGDPGRRTVRRPDRRRPGERGPGRAVVPGGGARPSGAAPPGTARRCAGCRSPGRR